MADKKAETIKKERDTRHDKLANWRSYWQDLAEFCLPRKAFVTRPRTRGERYNFRRVFDTTAIRSLRIMAAGFHSNLTNPSSKWFNLQTRDIGYMDDKSVKEWFKEVEDIMFTTFNTTNFDTTMHEFYSNAGAFGTGVVFIQEDEENDITFTLLAPESVILEEDTAERIKRIWVTFKYTAQQAHDLWGDNAGKVVATAMENGKEETELDFILRVTPRAKREEGKEDKADRVEEKATEVIAPIAAPRVEKPQGVHYTAKWYGDVTDFALLSDEYKIINQPMINKIIQATKGTISIPGVKARSEKIVNSRG